MTKILITLIIPCFNEEANIQKGVLDKIGNYTKKDPRFSEVIIVDDGSSDSSVMTIKNKYLTQFSKFKLIENNHQGKAQALITGINQSKSDFVMFSDIDLATPLEEAEKLIVPIKDGYKIIIGSRSAHREGAPLLRKLMAVGFIYIRNILIGLNNIHDTQCGFKLFEKAAALRIVSLLRVSDRKRRISGSSVSAGFDLEFLFIASRLGFKIIEIPVIWKHVETKNVNFIRDTIDTLKDIFQIKYYDMVRKYDFS